MFVIVMGVLSSTNWTTKRNYKHRSSWAPIQYQSHSSRFIVSTISPLSNLFNVTFLLFLAGLSAAALRIDWKLINRWRCYGNNWIVWGWRVAVIGCKQAQGGHTAVNLISRSRKRPQRRDFKGRDGGYLASI